MYFCNLKKPTFLRFRPKAIFAIFFLRRSLACENQAEIGNGLSNHMRVICVLSLQTGALTPFSSPQPIRLNLAKNDDFLSIFELLRFSRAERPEAPVNKIVRVLRKHSTYPTTRAQPPWFLQKL